MEGSFWSRIDDLVLASRSPARRGMLVSAGIPVEAVPADVDERKLEAGSTDTPAGVAALLARSKAAAVSAQMQDRLVLGADQVLACDGQRFSKPGSMAEARHQLLALSGRTHELVSAYCLMENGEVQAEGFAVACITMRQLSAQGVERYLRIAGPAVMQSVGAYQIENIGVQLMAQVEGDHFTILGLPLIAVLADLRRLGALAA